MLVDVVPLRRRGLRLAREEVLASAPVRGVLQLDVERPAAYYRTKLRAPLLAGLRAVDKCEWALPCLSNARVQKVKSRGMLILGIEEFDRPGRRGVDRFPQAWWVRVVIERASSVNRT